MRQIVERAREGIHDISRCSWHDVVGRSSERFICSTGTLVFDAPSVRGQVGLFPLSPSLFAGITAFPLAGLFFVIPRLEHGGGGIHSQLNIQDGEFSSLRLLLGFLHR
jgi:hypothetical protein